MMALASFRRRLIAGSIVLALCLGSGVLWADQELAWQALQSGGAVAMMRHALAPGSGDPSGFRLEQCATQRNLSAAGRAQAAQIGTAFRQHSVVVERVYSSQWCRCLETARLLDHGAVEALPALNSFFATPQRREPQMRTLRTWLANLKPQEVVLLVTHQVVITALTGVFPSSGEIVVLRPLANGEVEVLGQILPP